MRIEVLTQIAERTRVLFLMRRVYAEAKASSESRSSRDADYYYRAFFYTPQNLEGKRILDIGAGDSDFSECARKLGAAVVNLDTDYKKKPPPVDTEWIAKYAQKIPFADETFDEVIASFSLFWMKAGRMDALREAIRVAKTGGKVKIHPAYLVTEVPIQLKDYLELKDVEGESFKTLEITKSSEIKDWRVFAKDILTYFDFREERYRVNFDKTFPIVRPRAEANTVE